MHYKGKLYLIPNYLDSGSKDDLPLNQLKIIYTINEFIVESEKKARAFLKSIEHPLKQDNFIFHIYNEHNLKEVDFSDIFKNCISGSNIGLISDAGIPCVADPGAFAVEFAHKKNIEVVPFGGNSSIFLALMASGLGGQNFKFNGYLPLDTSLRIKKVKTLENEMLTNGITQIFMETPYRNNQLLELLIKNLKNETILYVAAGITSPNQIISRMNIVTWKNKKIDLNKIPCIFIIGK